MTAGRDCLIRLAVAVGAGALVVSASLLTRAHGATCPSNNDGKIVCSRPILHHRPTARRVDANGNRIVIGGRPAGCPHAYCGCGLRKYLGFDDARLNLAWNWARMFRRASAGPGIVAVRRHHVMLLLSHVSGFTYMVRDYNGGRRLSYIHARNVRGYLFVDPSSRTSLIVH